MTEEVSRNVELELAELICIEHTLSPSQAVTGSAEAGTLGPGKDTCLKIGTAILEAMSNQRPIAVSFTEEELWLLRERVSIYTSQGASADLGLVIKAKLYQALLSIGNKRAAIAATSEVIMAEGPTEEPTTGLSREEVDDAVRRWNGISGNRRNATPWGTTYHTDNDSRDGPKDDPGSKAPAKP